MEKFYEEYVEINGIKQYFLHYPTESDCIVLFLHGGPGQSQAQLSYKIVQEDRNFSIVYYDQRGTGRTQAKNKSKKDTITLEVLIEDLRKTVEYIRKKYTNKKLILLGHSWGSILGMEYIKKYSNTIDAYVGMGQVVNFKDGEKAAYDHCFEIASEKDKKKLLKIKGYPYSLTLENFNKTCPKFRRIQAKYKLMGYSGGNSKLGKIFMKSPIFKFKDFFLMMKAAKTNVNLLKYLAEFNISDYTNFSIPIYFICGENDWQVPSTIVEEYFKTISALDKELYWIKNAGHITDLDNSLEYNSALSAICKRIK